LVDAASLGKTIAPEHARELVIDGEKIKAAIRDAFDVVHPVHEEVRDVTFVTWLGPMGEESGTHVASNATVVSPGKIDRSPCGTASSARVAAMHARGDMAVGDTLLSRSILGTEFRIAIEEETTLGAGDAKRPAIRPSIAGRAWITGDHTYHLDPEDPFPVGYALGDTWHQVV
ncbi:MAG: proline racemase family protein, partial [Pseudomonadota bacterium]